MHRALAALLVAVLVAGLASTLPPGPASAHPGHTHTVEAAAAADPVLPPGFRDDVVIATGLDQPTAGAQAGDGRIFVLQKDGQLKMFDSLADTQPTTLLDLAVEVHNYIDRGALGMVLDPAFDSNGRIYLMYTVNGYVEDPPGTPPRWNDPDLSPYYDGCPTETAGCEVSNQIVRYRVSGNQAVERTVLVRDWCQQYFSHSAGDLQFGADGYLYASGGEGASYTDNENYDYGQFGNPCNDPMPAGNEQGGRLRAQDVRTLGDPTTLSGSVIRINAATGAPAPGNPLSANPNADTNAKRMVAHGFRNPFRMAVRPGTNDLYVGDVGESRFEEVNRVGDNRSTMVNAGWPCFEGPSRYPGIAEKPLCGNLPDDAVTPPLYKYGHTEAVTVGEECGRETGSVSALAFARDEDFPAGLRGGLVFGDYARNCIWYLPPGPGGVPDGSQPRILVERAGTPVDLFTGNDGALYYVDIGIGANFENLGGKIHRISYDPGRPTARLRTASGSRPWGDAPLSVQLDASGSSDPDGGRLSYRWDLDGDGSFETNTGTTATASWTYSGSTNVVVRVRVSDGTNTDEASLTVYPDNHPPDIGMYAPAAGLRWAVGQRIPFEGNAIDPDDGDEVPISWSFTIQHCPGDCHSHPLLSAPGTKTGTLTTIDHELPSSILARITATDERGLSATFTRVLQPAALRAAFGTTPAGLRYAVNGRERRSPAAFRMIAGARVQVSTPARQYLGGRLYRFASWPGGRPVDHTLALPRRGEYVHRATFVPVRRQLRVVTRPAGLRFSVLRRPYRSVLRRPVQVGAPVRVFAPRTQVRRGYRYVFVRWSDGGARAHAFRMPGRDATLRAVFRRAGRA